MISGTTTSPAPISYERAAGEKIPGAFRDGTKLVVHRGADISQICLCCGRPTNGHRIVKCLHSNSFGLGGSTGSAGGAGTGTVFDVIIFIIYLIMLIVWIIAALADFAESRTRTVTYGLCESHRSLRTSLGWTAFATFIAGVISLIGGIVVLAHTGNGVSSVPGVIATVAGPVLWVVAAVVASRMPGPSLDREAGKELWLNRVGKVVVAAQPERVAAAGEKTAKGGKAKTGIVK